MYSFDPSEDSTILGNKKRKNIADEKFVKKLKRDPDSSITEESTTPKSKESIKIKKEIKLEPEDEPMGK